MAALSNPEIIVAQQAELELLREKVTALTNRANEIATVMAALLVEVAARPGMLGTSDAFISACGMLGYNAAELSFNIRREVHIQAPEDRQDILAQILKEVLEGTYLQEEADDEEHASDSASG